MAKGLREAEESEEAAQRHRETPAAEAEREESRAAYAGISAAEAEGLLEERFPKRLALLEQDPARALTGAKLERALGPTEALIEVKGKSLLMDGTFPVRTRDEEGALSKVNLTLQPEESTFTPANPVAPVTLPERVGEGLEVGESGVSVTPTSTAPQDAARRMDKEDLFYPEVEKDTDLLASVNSSGVELFSQLRSAESPEQLRYEVQLPLGAQLQGDGEGGALVSDEGRALARVPAPSATDAQGAEVPVTMSVEGDQLVVEVPHRSMDVAYPLLVDPAIEDEWYSYYGGTSWYAGGSLAALSDGTWAYTSSDFGRFLYSTYPIYATFGGSNRGLFISAKSTAETQWAYRYGEWSYTAPGKTTYIPAAGVYPFWRNDHGCSSSQYTEPHDFDGLWSPAWSPQYGWIQFQSNAALAYGQAFSEPPKDWREKTAQLYALGLGTGAYNTAAMPCWRDLYAGGAYVWLSDPEQPTLTTSSTAQWMDAVPVRLNVRASDPGLGVKSFTATATNAAGSEQSWQTLNPCTGLRANPCPAEWNLGEASQPSLSYEPSVLPEGIDKLSVTAYDALSKPSETTNVMTVRVDHAPPAISLSGTLTEQAKLGTELPSYKLRIKATDGVAGSENPADARSGTTRIAVEENGKNVVPPYEKSCPTQSCALEEELELKASQLSAGSHTLIIKATDALGHLATKELAYSTGDKQAPSLSVTGLPVESANATYASYWSSFGSAGSGNGQFSHPAGIAADAKGNLWVVDQGHYRIERFDESGEYMSQFGSQGTENGKFGRPTDVAVAANGNLWVTDAGNNRVEEFSEKGEFIAKVGTSGSGNLQFNGPESLAIDTKGNIWVADTYNHRVQELNEKGEFVRAFGTFGSGEGQIVESTGIAIGPGNNVWVADWGNNRVEEFSETGAFIRQFGNEGAGNGQFKRPDVIEIDVKGDVWVGDQNNARIQEFNQTGEYVTQFGSQGSGKGQFSLSWPMGIATDSHGDLWISDTGNNRVQRWLTPYATVTGQLDPINASATDTGFGVTSIKTKLTSASGSPELLKETTQSCANGQCSLSSYFEEPDLSAKPAGAYILTVSATDGAGNVRNVSRVLGVDPEPPTIKLSGTLAERASQPLNAPSGELLINASDASVVGSGIKTVNVERDHQRVASYGYSCASGCREVNATYRYSARRDGTERTVVPAAQPSGATFRSLTGASCSAASSCVAVGYYKNSAGTPLTLAERWNGSEWQVQSTPNPSGALESRLEAVNCVSTSNCTAVGYYKSASEAFATLVEKWNGTEWSVVSSPNPSGFARNYLYGVSCSSVSDCWAVGKAAYKAVEELEGKVPVALVEHWNGTAWSISSLSEPPKQLRRVSCSSGTNCLAVTGQEGLVTEQWNGTSWLRRTALTPSGGSAVNLKGISCFGSGCAAVGSYSRSGHTAPVIERWSGSEWSVQASIDPYGVLEEGSAQELPPSGVLEGVSCPSATACTAVGSYRNGALETQPLTESWDGTEWALQPTPPPVEGSAAVAESVSCAGEFECEAVGHYTKAGTQALIEKEAPVKDSHRITVEAVDKYGQTTISAIDVDVPPSTTETPKCSNETKSVAPKGTLNPSEATKAVETSLPEAVASSIQTTEEATNEQIDPSYSAPQPNLDATGSLVASETSVTPEGGVSLAEVACITPTATTSAATNATVVHGDSAVFANTAPETETVIRPSAGGATLVATLNGPEAPRNLSWNVTVPVGDKLEVLPSGAVAIVKAVEDEGSEGVAELPKPKGAETPEALNDAEVQLETAEYQLASAQAETTHEVIAVIAAPWIVISRNQVVPAEIAVVPDEEIPNEYVIEVSLPEVEQEGVPVPETIVVEATASTVVNGHCASTASDPHPSPCGDFKVLPATTYAEIWGKDEHNGHYHDYGSDNCTNFLSQIMRWGGMKFMKAFDHGYGSWWYHNLYTGGQYVSIPQGWDNTRSWSLADELPRHLWQFGLAHIDPVQQPWGWTAGDILAEDWYGTNGVGDFNHMQFVVGTLGNGSSREPYIANESSQGHNYPHRRWTAVREQIQAAEGQAGWNRAALAVKHTQANLDEPKHTPANLYGPNGLFSG